MVSVTIDGRETDVPSGTSILEASRGLGIEIPTLCYNEQLSAFGGCRICLVEVAQGAPGGRTRLLPACSTKVEAGFAIQTGSERVRQARRFVMLLLLSRSPDAPRLQELAKTLDVLPLGRATAPPAPSADETDGGAGPEPGGAAAPPRDRLASYLLERVQRSEETRCIRCGLCVRACAEISRRNAISFEGRGMKRRVVSPFRKVSDSCIGCGSCAYVCPTKTITIEEVAAEA